jgi:glycosyltransferase involved in cell wall biosynthesis
MKILWVSDSPTAPSGFGNVTRFVCEGLSNLGHDVSIIGWQIKGAPRQWGRCTIYPTRQDDFGADVLLGYLQQIQPDVLVTLADVWWLTFINNPAISGFMRIAGIPWALYYPIDGDLGEKRLPKSWIDILNVVDLPIAMAKYGKEVSEANGIACAYIPHGVDTSVFAPPADKEAAKRALGYENKFVIMSDARNQPRKMHPRTLDIYKLFSAGKNDTVLHLHCDKNDPASRAPEYSYDIAADIAALGLSGTVRFTQDMHVDGGGLPLDKLRTVYQAADVHLLSSWGEGFGLPTLQAACAGVVPMACDYTASAELTAGHGEPLPTVFSAGDQFGIKRKLIDIEATVRRLNALYHDRDLLARKSAASRRFALAYDWARIVPQWDTLLQEKVPALKRRLLRGAPTQRVQSRNGALSGSADVLDAMNRAGVRLPGGANLSISVVSQKPGTLLAGVFRDAFGNSSGCGMTIPVTLTSHDPFVMERDTGLVFIAGPADVALLRGLSAIFPRLKAWSFQDLSLGIGSVSGKEVRLTGISRATPNFDKKLAATTLLLDSAALLPDIRVPAAQLFVPCAGPLSCERQRTLWPGLCLSGEVAADIVLVRTLLVDQHQYESACTHAAARVPPKTAGKGSSMMMNHVDLLSMLQFGGKKTERA